MGHYCWMCGRARPNEKFSGRGHHNHLCKDCARRPREDRERISASIEIRRYMRQKTMSAKNIARLDQWSRSSDPEIRDLAGAVLEAARIKPYRKKRAGFLLWNHRKLYDRLVRLGVYLDPDDPDYDDGQVMDCLENSCGFSAASMKEWQPASDNAEWAPDGEHEVGTDGRDDLPF